MCASVRNKLTAALADYDEAIRLAPDQPDPYLNRGAALEGMGRWEDAIADYTRVLTIDPDDAPAYNNRGNARAGLGQWEPALEDYQKATALDPKFAFARVNAALVEFQLGNAQRSHSPVPQPDPPLSKLCRCPRRPHPLPSGPRARPEPLKATGVAVVGLDGRYKDLDWVKAVRRWPPAMVDALDSFLNL